MLQLEFCGMAVAVVTVFGLMDLLAGWLERRACNRVQSKLCRIETGSGRLSRR